MLAVFNMEPAFRAVYRLTDFMHCNVITNVCTFFLSFFSSGQTAVKLSGAEAADRAQCAAPD